MISIEKTLRGPGNTIVKVSVPLIGLVIALAVFFRWQRPILGGFYFFLDILEGHGWSIFFLGTTLVCLGLLLPLAYPRMKDGRLSITMGVLTLVGFLCIALKGVSPWMSSTPRLSGPSIGLIQLADENGLQLALTELVDGLTEEMGEPVELRRISTGREDLIETLRGVKRYEHDIVILDYDPPLDPQGSDLPGLINPRSLYLLLRPGNPEEGLPPNVVALHPPVVEEVNALMALIGSPEQPIRLMRSSSRRAALAAKLLRHALDSRGLTMAPENVLPTDQPIESLPGEITVWLGWCRKELQDGSSVDGPGVIKETNDGALSLKTLTPLPYVTASSNGEESWRMNQMVALKAIFKAHFLEARRPLDARVSVNAAVQRLADVHLATVSREMKLVARYTTTQEVQ